MKKGFTLVELLAVIVILAIISLIAIPSLSGVIKKTKVNASIESANGYIKSINTQIVSSELRSSRVKINNGTYNVDDLEIDYNGKGPSAGLVVIENNEVKDARLCIDNNSFDYDGEIKLSSNDYCSDTNITILSNGKNINATTKTPGKYTLDLKDITNINCSNGATVEVNGSTLTVKNAIGSTTCDMASNLKYTFTHLNDGDNNVVMVSDENSSDTEVVVEKNNIVNFNLNGKTLNIKMIGIKGKLNAFDNNKQGKIISQSNTFNLGGTATLSAKNISAESMASGVWVSGVCDKCIVNVYNSDFSTEAVGIGTHGTSKNSIVNIYENSNIISKKNPAIQNDSNNIFNIYDGNFISETNYTVKNVGSGSLNIYGGSFISSIITINNVAAGTININQTNKPVYIKSTSLIWNIALRSGEGVLNIKANIADKCTNNATDTKKGLCVIAIGNGSYGKSNDTGNGAVGNNTGKINIDGGTYIGSYKAIESGTGIVNIKNAYLKSIGYFAVSAYGTGGLVNICDSKIESQNIDLRTYEVSTINYDTSTIFTSGTNSPQIENKKGTINANYMGTCTE